MASRKLVCLRSRTLRPGAPTNTSVAGLEGSNPFQRPTFDLRSLARPSVTKPLWAGRGASPLRPYVQSPPQPPAQGRPPSAFLRVQGSRHPARASAEALAAFPDSRLSPHPSGPHVGPLSPFHVASLGDPVPRQPLPSTWALPARPPVDRVPGPDRADSSPDRAVSLAVSRMTCREPAHGAQGLSSEPFPRPPPRIL